MPSKASTICGTIILPFAGSRLWLCAALLLTLAGWGVFTWAAIEAGRHGSRMRGYEWIPGACIVPFSIFFLVGIRRGRGWGQLERDASENEACWRISLLAIFIGGAYIAAFIIVPIQWLGASAVGPLLEHTSWAASSSSLHSPQPSPTPSTSPAHHKNTEEADMTVGILLFVQMLLLTLAVFSYWQYGEHYRLEEARLESDASDELATL